MKRSILLWGAVLLVGAGCSGKEPEISCVADVDCADGTCVDGECVFVVGTDSGNDMRGTTDSGGNADQGGGACTPGSCAKDTVCNTASGQCVECLTDSECGVGGQCDPATNTCGCATGFHRCAGICASDTAVETCGASCDPCPTDPGGTASCVAGQCQLACNAPLVWDDAAQTCVGCTQNSECINAEASTCSGGECTPCASDGDCSHIAGKGVCDAGTCVECSDANSTACGANSCDPATGTCTQTAIGSLDWCAPCVADGECADAQLCVPMEFAGAARDTMFCLPIANPDCARPLSRKVSKTSSSGLTIDMCTVNEMVTTCEAVKDYGSTCGDASDCGADGLDDALCEPIDFEPVRCTLPCETVADCPETTQTGCNLGGPFCGSY